MDPRVDQEETGGFSGGGIDLRHYWHVFKKRWWIMLATVIVVATASVVVAMHRPRIYQAAASVIIEPQAPRVLGGETVEVQELGQGSAFWDNAEYFNTQERILTSRSLARAVVEKYSLHKDARLVVPAPGASEEDLIERATGIVRGAIDVKMISDSRVLQILIRDGDPGLARDLANWVADVYIERNVSKKHDVTRDAKRYVAQQLDEAKGELDRAEKALYAFKKDNNILYMSLENQRNQVSKDLDTYASSLTEAERRSIDLKAKRNALSALLNDGSSAAPSSFFTPSATIETLRSMYLDERRKLQVLEERYGPKHPEVLAQRARVETSLQDLKEEVGTLLRSLDGELRALAESIGQYKAKVAALTDEAHRINEKEKDYKQLTRDAASADENYTLLLRRLNESKLEERNFANNISLLDEARLPNSPVEPNVRKSAFVGFALGVMLALGLAFLIEFLDRSIKSQDDIEGVIGLPFLGMVPSVSQAEGAGQPELFIAKQPTSTVAECCRVVRTNILFSSPDKPLRTLVVSSSNPVEGKTMNVVQLGIVMAQGGHKTLLVDTDMRRPRLHKALRASNENGVSRVVVGEATLESAVKSTDVPNLFLLPCGPIPPNPAELLQTERFAALVRTLAEKYDRVIFDSPPALAVTDAVVLSRLVDGTVLVVRAGRTSRDALMRTRRAMAAVGTRITGVVLNDVNLKNPHYASYYQYQYKYHETPAAAGAAPSGEA